MDMVFENQINCQEKIEQAENEQDEVEIAFDDLDDSNAIALNLDSSGQYQLQGESVTYRLVQLTSPDEVQHILSSITSNQTTQANTIQPGDGAVTTTNPKSYVQAATRQDPAHLNANNNNNKSQRQVIVLATQQQQHQNGYTTTSNNNIYPKTIIPKNVVIKSEPITKTMKDDRRRFTHKEVERRRRDKINMWIVQLGNLIPECSSQHPRQPDSKGGILSKACEYITELQSENHEMEESLKSLDDVKNHLQLLNQQFEQLKQENQLLRSHLQQQQQQQFTEHGLIAAGGDVNGVELLDDTAMVMEGSDGNSNFIGKYHFLATNADDDGLYGESSCLVADGNNNSNQHNYNIHNSNNNINDNNANSGDNNATNINPNNTTILNNKNNKQTSHSVIPIDNEIIHINKVNNNNSKNDINNNNNIKNDNNNNNIKAINSQVNTIIISSGDSNNNIIGDINNNNKIKNNVNNTNNNNNNNGGFKRIILKNVSGQRRRTGLLLTQLTTKRANKM